MISIGVVFYNEKQENLNLFFNYFSNALSRSSAENCNIKEIIFVQNSKNKLMERYLTDFLNKLKKSNEFLNVSLIQNTVNNISLARRKIIESAIADWVYFTDPDVYLNETVFVDLASDIVNCQAFKILGITGQLFQKSDVGHLNSFFKIADSIGNILNLAFQGSKKKIGTLIDHSPSAHLLLNRSIVLQLGNFSSEFTKCGEDLDLTHRATQNGFLIYFGKSSVVHVQNFGFADAAKKFFHYGQAQAEVFLKNGFCLKRIYRLVPAAGSLAIAVFLFGANKMILICTGVMLMVVLLLKAELIFSLFFAIIYGVGTLSKFFLESCTLNFCGIFRKTAKKRA